MLKGSECWFEEEKFSWEVLYFPQELYYYFAMNYSVYLNHLDLLQSNMM
jgi:hypothetical protein